MEALIIIDYTNDFVATDGALTCGDPGQKIEKTIVELAEEFSMRGDYVVLATDKHEKEDSYHPETKLFPPHNIIGTSGRNFYGQLNGWSQRHFDDSSVHFMDKTRYSAFAGTDLDIKLRERQIKTLHLVGVCTDICVLHTAVAAYNLGYQIVIHKKGVASFNQTGHEWALDHFKNTLGATIL